MLIQLTQEEYDVIANNNTYQGNVPIFLRGKTYQCKPTFLGNVYIDIKDGVAKYFLSETDYQWAKENLL